MPRKESGNIPNSLFFFLNKILILFQRFFLELIRSILFRRKISRPRSYKEKILVFKTGGLGDFLFGVPAIRLLKNQRPEVKLVLLTQIAFGGIHLRNLRDKGLTQVPWLELVNDLFETSHLIGDLSIDSIFSLKKDLRSHNIKTVILMPGPGEPFMSILKKILLLKFLGMGGCELYGIRQNYSLGFFRKFHARWGLAVHKIYGPWRAVESFLNGKFDLNDSYLKLGGREFYSKKNAHRLLQKEVKNINDYVVVSPGSSAEWKGWGQKNFKNLITKLAPFLHKKNISILLAGPMSDYNLGKDLTIALNVFNICGKYSISELAIIHQHSLCSVSTDGGAAHLAAFTGTKVISLSNGGEEPGIVTPVGPNVIEHRNLTSCTPCFGMTFCPLGHSQCIRDIPVPDIIKSVIKSCKID